jgi:hypothetical protein
MMTEHVYTEAALIRDLVNAISFAQKKPIDLGAQPAETVNRAYIMEVVADVIRIVANNPKNTKSSSLSSGMTMLHGEEPMMDVFGSPRP